MYLIEIFSLHVLRANQTALQQSGDKRSCSCEWIKNMHILFCQRRIEFLPQYIINRMDDKVNTLHRCINNTKFVNSLWECSLEEFLIQILDDCLLAFKIVNVADIDAH